MAVFAVAFAAFLFEYNHLVAFHEGTFNLANNFCPFNGGRAYFYGTVGVNEENAVEFNGLALFFLVAEIVDIQKLACFGFELLSLDFYNAYIVNLWKLIDYAGGRAMRPLVRKPVTAKKPTKLLIYFGLRKLK
jgi:hypothetical protein